MTCGLFAMAVLVAQTPVGPEDAFRANYAAIEAEVRYTFSAGIAPLEALDRLRTLSSDGISFVEDPSRTSEVSWACDGVAHAHRLHTGCLSHPHGVGWRWQGRANW